MRNITAAAVSLMVTACSGMEPPDRGVRITELSGLAYALDPMSNAELEVFDFREAEKGSKIGETTTDSGGKFRIEVGAKYGSMLIEVAYGTSVIQALVTDLEEGEKVEGVLVHPVGSLSAAYATHLIRNGDQPTHDAAKEKADTLVFEHFGGVSPATIPKPPLDDQTFLDEQLVLGVLIASLQMQAQRLDSSSSIGQFLAVLSDDLRSDGKFNGRDMGRLFLGSTEITGDTLRPDFAVSIREFLSSDHNQTHFDAQHFEEVILEIETAESMLFEGPPTPPDRNPPTVQIVSPANGATVAGVIMVIAEASDEEGNLIDVEALAPEELYLQPNAVQEGVYEGTIDSSHHEEGALEIRVQAIDKAGNDDSHSVNVTIANTGALSGYAFKGFVSGATVTAYQFNPDGNEVVLDSTTTDNSGQFVLDMGGYEGPTLLVATGGSFVGEALNQTIEFSRTDYLSAVVPSYTPSYASSVSVSPLTTWAAELAEHLVLDEGFEPVAAAVEANSIVSEHFSGLEILSTVPVDLLAGQSCMTLTERVEYALYCAGLSELALQISEESGFTPGAVVNEISLSGAIAEDISDGLLDGRKGSRQLTQGDYLLSSYTLRTELARAVVGWLASDLNPCAVSVVDFVDSANMITEDTGPLFPASDPVIPWDNQVPDIELTSHEDGQTVFGPIVVTVEASDLSGVISTEILHPAGMTDLDPMPDRVRFELDASSYSGEILIQIQSQDTVSNIGQSEFRLYNDDQGPDISFDPPNGSYVSDTVFSFQGTVEDPSGVESVTIESVPTPVGDEGQFASPAFTLLDQENVFAIVATDNLGNETQETYTVYLDRVRPTITVLLPNQGDTFVPGDVVQIEATATDTSGIYALTVEVEGELLEDQDPSPDRIEALVYAADYEDGDVTILYAAADMAGNDKTEEVTIQIRSTGTASGLVYKGPVQGAQVRAFDWSSGSQGEDLTQDPGITGSDGRYSVSLSPSDGPVLFRAKEGSYKGEARAEYDTPVNLQDADFLLGLVESQGSGGTPGVMITPFTTLAVLLAEHLVNEGAVPVEAISDAAARIESIFGFPLSTQPANCREDQNLSFDHPARAGLLLAGLSWMATHDFGTDKNALMLLRLVYEDLEADGKLDGHGIAGAPLQLGGVNLNANTLRATLGRAIYRFIESDYNSTGLQVNDTILAWLNTFALNTDGLFGSQDPLPVDVEPPVITWESHQDNEWVSGTITVSVLVWDNDTVPDVEVEDINEQTEIVDERTRRVYFQLDTVNQGEVDYQINYHAVDRSGNETTATLTLRIDNHPPVLTWSSPLDNAVIRDESNPGQVTFTGTATDARRGVDRVIVDGQDATLDGDNWSITITYQASWDMQVSVQAVDLNGHQSPVQTRSITVITDFAPPEIMLESHQDNEWVNGTITVSALAWDNDVTPNLDVEYVNEQTEIVECTHDNELAECTRAYFQLNTVAAGEGDHPVHFRAVDRSGNETTTTLNLRIDNHPPELNWLSPVDNAEIRNTANPGLVAFVGTVSDGDGRGVDRVVVDGQDAILDGNAWSIEITYPESWSRDVSVYAVDLNGHQSAVESRSIKVVTDFNPPEVEFTSHELNEWVNGAAFVVTATAFDPGQLAPQSSTPPGFELVSASDGNPTVIVDAENPCEYSMDLKFKATNTSDGELVIYVKATDRWSNSSEDTQLHLHIDNTAPAVEWRQCRHPGQSEEEAPDEANEAIFNTGAGYLICWGTAVDHGRKEVTVTMKNLATDHEITTATDAEGNWTILIPVAGDDDEGEYNKRNTLDLTAQDGMTTPNVSEIETKTVIINTDVNAPVLEFENNNNWARAQINVEVTATDARYWDNNHFELLWTNCSASENCYKDHLTWTVTEPKIKKGVFAFNSTDDADDDDIEYDGPADGDFDFTVKATDAIGNVSQQTYTLKIDNTQPDLTATNEEQGSCCTGLQDYDVTMTGTVSDAYSGIDQVTINGLSATVNGNQWSRNIHLDDVYCGSKYFPVEAKDRAGNTKSTTATFNIYYRGDEICNPHEPGRNENE